MTIEIHNPEVERIVNEAVLSGRYGSAQDVVLEAMAAWSDRHPVDAPVEPTDKVPSDELRAEAKQALKGKNLVELFAPIRGLFKDGELDFSRDPSPGRPVDLP